MFNHGAVHTPDSHNFYKSVNAPARVLSIVKDGLKLPFLKEMPVFWYKNNATARNDMNFVRSKVDEWCKSGFVQKVDFRPKHISPLTVASRVIQTGELRKRLCFDSCNFSSLILIKQKEPEHKF